MGLSHCKRRTTYGDSPRYEIASAVSEDAAKQLFYYVEQEYFRDPAPALKYSEDDFETAPSSKRRSIYCS
ncbi:hypothetical protein ABU162_16585 [Paenibacillus thiaminolyticus]|uniref:hypothetical protein n=1 Tax=Paenibacillus thiaminolyticus TaxID=49283 RepID=UPI0035A572EC